MSKLMDLGYVFEETKGAFVGTELDNPSIPAECYKQTSGAEFCNY